MHNTTSRELVPSSNSSDPGEPRRPRPVRGIDVPATLWLPPNHTVPDRTQTEPAVLPAWALRRAVTEYAVPGQAVASADTRGFYAGRRTGFQPLPACHDPRPETRPTAPRRHEVRLAILEIETRAQHEIDLVYPDENVDLVHDFVRPALRAAACMLACGGILAVALCAPEPGRASQLGPRLLHAAQDAGFSYQQHIAVVTGDLDGERIIPRLTIAQTHAVNHARRHHIPALAPTHLDLAVFTLDQEAADA